jgi:hypothetical protein
MPGELQALFTSYREAMPDPEPSTNFMPHLWSKIESRHKAVMGFGRLARWFVTAAGAICLLMSVLLFSPLTNQSSQVYSATYLEVLSNEHSGEEVVGLEAVSRTEGSDSSSTLEKINYENL